MSKETRKQIDQITEDNSVERTFEIVIRAAYTKTGDIYSFQFGRETLSVRETASGKFEVDRDGDARFFTPNPAKVLAFSAGAKPVEKEKAEAAAEAGAQAETKDGSPVLDAIALLLAFADTLE